MIRRHRTLLGLVLALCLGVALSGCVQMPDSGPVVVSRSGGDVTSESGIYIDPRPPQPGDTRPGIVKGFLTAMTATPIQTSTARKFLSQDAAESWNPERGIITYADATPPREVDQEVTVRLSGADRLDARGAWEGALPRSQRTLRFPMTFQDGQWRIDRAPDALIVPESWFEQRFRQVSLYFFDPTATVLVPEPVFVPRGEQLATTLTQGLLMGPGPGLKQVSQSFVPPGLDFGLSVPVSEDGIADIALRGDVGQLTAKTVELMAAQFAWTLRQEPAIEGLRISIDGEPLQLPGGGDVYRVDGGAEYDPTAFRASPLLYGLRGGRLVSGPATSLDPVDGPFGTRSYGLRSIGVNLSATRVAGVTDGGTSVLVAPLSGAGKVRQVVSGATDLLRPAWDVANRLWLIDRTAQGARVIHVEGTHRQMLRVPGITGQDVRSFLVSRDGSRLVAVVQRRAGDVVVVSRIEHRRTGSVLGATPAEQISTGAAVPIRAIAWRTATSVAVLTPFTRRLVQVATASVDGSPAGAESAPIPVEDRLLSLAGSPADGESLFGVARRKLVDLSGPDRRVLPLERGVSDVQYVG